MRARFLWHVPYLERVRGPSTGVPRGPVDPRRPREFPALVMTIPTLPSCTRYSPPITASISGSARAGNRRFGSVTHPKRSYKGAIQNRFIMENAKGA